MKNHIIIITIICLFCAFCSCTYQPSEENSPPEETMKPKEKILSIINGFDRNNDSTFDRVEEIVEIGEPAVPYLIELLYSNDTYHKWAALYALSRIGHEVDRKKQEEIISHVKNLFDDKNPTIRQTAAGIAVGLGEKEGIPILIEYLKSDDTRLLSKPRRSLSSYSISVLRYYTRQNFGYSIYVPMDEREEAIKKWENWWEKNKDSLVWDPNIWEYGGYVIKS
ncbi:MAG: hypothetical protein DRO95_00795 [Candidatus Altiarchaeales archaeon]|nr:MAG: hypothetical protein DRO95_00795 [Candidatus Altiarchaeales archaeon]HDO82484.1 HEAT repeat domain-containing protein [Candidatus Altiarchaeales archaeon]HEX55133.1 HEAT repeat domain-containing protein [Candidatus Altiarchaeales archaeon]